MDSETKKILNHIVSPGDLKGLSVDELKTLAEEIRTLIIETVSTTGGHLASSLGAVELTLALHYVFNAPRDKIIWDVGHQAYAHKIITGRRDRFNTLRKLDGISGFPKRSESEYDVFGVGHSSTSISAAAGIVEARCLTGDDYKVIAVIGDGSMSAGMAYEGINWTGDRQKDIIIVLNDNEMSISPNVGAMSSYLNSIMTGQQLTRLRAEVKKYLRSVPGIGEQMVRLTKQAEEALKGFFVPGVLFEEMGFMYVGPLEGHRIDHLIRNFQNIKELKRPLLVHVITKKGKGYEHAEEAPERFHGVGPFDVAEGELKKPAAPPSYTQVFGETMEILAREDDRIVAITAAMGRGTGLQGFAQLFPGRFFDVGIAEQHGVTLAAGLATEGMIPVVAIYSTFLQRAFDQVVHDVCLQNLHVVFALDRAGVVGDDGPTHHGLLDLSYLRCVPNMVVMAPKDENELAHMVKTAVCHDGPVAVRYPRGAGLGVPRDTALVPCEIGRGERLRDGRDAAILALGSTVNPSCEAAEILAKEGIDVAVVNARFIKPLDADLLLETAARVKHIVIVEENVLMGGFGSAVLELFQERGLTGITVERRGIDDTFVEQGPQAILWQRCGIDAAGIMSAVKACLEG